MSRRAKLGLLCLALGIACLIAALGFFQHNREEALDAAQSAREVMEQLAPAIEAQAQDEIALPSVLDTAMDTVEIDGNLYIGFLTVPSLELQLPVMADWDFDKLPIAPCRYSGTLRGNDLTIAAHNYLEHFGHLHRLSIGDEVRFCDVHGAVTRYTVAELEILSPDSVEEMTAGDYDLTLFTCTYGGASRFTVRCLRSAD